MRSGLLLLDVLQGGLERGDIAVDVAQDRQPSRHSAVLASTERPGVGDDERDRRLAADLAIDAGDRPAAAEALAELVHGHLERQPVTGLDRRA